jgi:hypothetical protein
MRAVRIMYNSLLHKNLVFLHKLLLKHDLNKFDNLILQYESQFS